MVGMVARLCRLGINQLKGELAHLIDDGLRAVLVFGVPEKVIKVCPFRNSVCVLYPWQCASFRSGLKDEKGTSADSDDNPAILAAKKLRELFPKLLLVCDVCLCPYTNHGHCGMWISTSAILDGTFFVHFAHHLHLCQGFFVRTILSTTPKAYRDWLKLLWHTLKQVSNASYLHYG